MPSWVQEKCPKPRPPMYDDGVPGFLTGLEGRDKNSWRSRAPNTATTATAPDSGQSYGAPLATVTTLFFMWGFLTCLNDILVPHLKSIFDLNYTKLMLIQFAFFGAYFIFSLPSAKIIDAIGYQTLHGGGPADRWVSAHFLFVPAASVPSYPLFLGALIVLAAGITCLQVAANPYVTVLGKPETASSRLNLTQAFNSLGTFLAPFFGGSLILSAAPNIEEIRALAPDALQPIALHEAATVKTPYVGLGIALVVLAVAIGSFKLPKIEHAQHQVGEKVNDSIWKHPNLIFGAIAIFVYVGAEVSIGSFLVNYFSSARNRWTHGERLRPASSPSIGAAPWSVGSSALRFCKK